MADRRRGRWPRRSIRGWSTSGCSARSEAQASKPPTRAAATTTSSLLDLALEDANRLRGRLGRDDQFKLDEYMDAVRSVERRLEFSRQPDQRELEADADARIKSGSRRRHCRTTSASTCG